MARALQAARSTAAHGHWHTCIARNSSELRSASTLASRLAGAPPGLAGKLHSRIRSSLDKAQTFPKIPPSRSLAKTKPNRHQQRNKHDLLASNSFLGLCSQKHSTCQDLLSKRCSTRRKDTPKWTTRNKGYHQCRSTRANRSSLSGISNASFLASSGLFTEIKALFIAKLRHFSCSSSVVARSIIRL